MVPLTVVGLNTVILVRAVPFQVAPIIPVAFAAVIVTVTADEPTGVLAGEIEITEGTTGLTTDKRSAGLFATLVPPAVVTVKS
jgi:hypothetical protein